MQRHQLSAAWGTVDEPRLAELADSIRRYGQLDTITVFEGEILDGFHRFEACRLVGIEPRMEELKPGVDPVSYVIAKNAHRRDLTASQRADAVIRCFAWAKTGRPEKGDGPSPFLESASATVEEMAKKAKVSKRTIQRAKKARDAGLGDAVRSGKVSVERAAELADLPEEERAAAVEQPKPKPMKEQKPFADEPEPCLRCAELSDMLDEAQADLEILNKLAEADDKVAAALEEVRKVRNMNEVLTSRLHSQAEQLAQMTKAANRWKNKADQLEKDAKNAAAQPF